MKVTAVQMKGARDQVALARERSVALAASSGPADLVVFPEMALTGYVFASREEALAVSEEAQGETFEAWSQLAVSLGAWVVGGFLERDRDRLFNSALVIDDEGRLASVYRKTMLYVADRGWAHRGDTPYARFETAHGAFGVGICMDINDERFLLWLARAKLDAIAFPTNWIDDGSDIWTYWTERVSASGAALVAANTWGVEPGVSFSGRSVVLANGKVLASAPLVGDKAVGAVLPRRGARSTRSA
jgi:predicted amidohydrolase